jgi:hypothetical protein
MPRSASASVSLVAIAALLAVHGPPGPAAAAAVERPAWAIVERHGTLRARPLDSAS